AGIGIEVVDDDRLAQRHRLQGEMVQKVRVPAESLGAPGHGGVVAAQAAGDLAMGRAGDQPLGDGDAQLGPLQVIGKGETLLREGPPAGSTAKTRNDRPVSATVAAMPKAMERAEAPLVLRAPRPGTEGRQEELDALDDRG